MLVLFAVACATAHASLSDLFKTPAQQAAELRARLPIIGPVHGYSMFPLITPGKDRLIIIGADFNNLPAGAVACFTSFYSTGTEMICHAVVDRIVMLDGSVEYVTEGIDNKRLNALGRFEHYVDPIRLKAKYFVGVAWGYGPIKEPAQLLAGFNVKPASNSSLAAIYAIAAAATEASKGVRFEPTAR